VLRRWYGPARLLRAVRSRGAGPSSCC
jgi:hypothetical protein